MANIKAWIGSFRLRTLPLALSCTGMGSFLAAGFRLFNFKVFILTSATAIFLQVLSNLANDYGDTVHGTDNTDRVGPQRALQSGHVSLKAMRNAIIVCAALAFTCGIGLLYEATEGMGTSVFIIFLLLGLACIAAAIRYTVGRNPYGYAGLGDISVFFFFGIVGVGGTFYLHTHALPLTVLLPAAALGFLSAGVLNINNMRDITNDTASGKKTLVVRMGIEKAKRYHVFLIVLAAICMLAFTYRYYSSSWQWSFLVAVLLLFVQLKNIVKEQPEQMDKYLKQLSLTTLLMVFCFGISSVFFPYA